MTVVEFGTFFFNNWFAYNVVNRSNFFEVNGYIYIFLSVFAVFQSFCESFFGLVLFAVDVVSGAVFSNSSLYFIKHNLVASSWNARSNTGYNVFLPVLPTVSWVLWCMETCSFQFFLFFFGHQNVFAGININVSIPFAVLTTVVLFFAFNNGSVVYYVSQFNVAYCVDSVRTWFVVSIVYELIISVQRHPDNVTWFEVYVLAVVQRSGSFLNDVAIFVGYKQFTIKFEVARPISLVVRASAVGNSKSVSAHAKYHSRSQCYGKYFFHSLSSS